MQGDNLMLFYCMFYEWLVREMYKLGKATLKQNR